MLTIYTIQCKGQDGTEQSYVTVRKKKRTLRTSVPMTVQDIVLFYFVCVCGVIFSGDEYICMNQLASQDFNIQKTKNRLRGSVPMRAKRASILCFPKKNLIDTGLVRLMVIDTELGIQHYSYDGKHTVKKAV